MQNLILAKECFSQDKTGQNYVPAITLAGLNDYSNQPARVVGLNDFRVFNPTRVSVSTARVVGLNDFSV